MIEHVLGASSAFTVHRTLYANLSKSRPKYMLVEYMPWKYVIHSIFVATAFGLLNYQMPINANDLSSQMVLVDVVFFLSFSLLFTRMKWWNE